MIFGYQNHKLSAWPLLYFVLMADIWNFCDTFLGPKSKSTFFCFSKCWFVAEIQGFKVTLLVQVKSKVPIVWRGHISTFCLMQMVEIFVEYSKDSKLKALFYLSKSWFVAEIQRFKVTPFSARKIVPIVRTGHFHTFCWSKMIEIFVVYLKDPDLRNFFYFSKSWNVAETQGFKATQRLSTKADFSGVDISGSIGYRNKRSSVLYSTWASDHLYRHGNNWITVSTL